MSRTIVVTGSRGYLGSRVAQSLIHEGNRVVGLDRAGSPENVDLRDRNSLARLNIGSESPIVVHLAGLLPGVTRGRLIMEESLHAAQNVMDVLRPRRMLFISSTAVYPLNDSGPRPAPRPWEAYGRAKLATEQLIQAESSDWTIFRVGTLFASHRRGGIKALMDRGIAGKVIPLPRSGRVHHPFVHTDDVVGSIVRWAGSPDRFRQKTVDLVARNPETMASLLEEAATNRVRIANLPHVISKLGSDSFPALGISRWHLRALGYDLPALNPEPWDLPIRMMAEVIRCSYEGVADSP